MIKLLSIALFSLLQQSSGNVDLNFDFGPAMRPNKTISLLYTPNMTVWLAMNESTLASPVNITQEFVYLKDHRVFVVAIDGVHCTTDIKCWQVMVDGKPVNETIDMLELKDSDQVDWTFEKIGDDQVK